LDYDHPCFVSSLPFNSLRLLGLTLMSPFHKKVGKFPKNFRDVPIFWPRPLFLMEFFTANALNWYHLTSQLAKI
jgi:hypothetical protein